MTHVPMLRPMGLFEIVDQTFRLYRANFWLFFGIAAIVYIPIGLLQMASPQTNVAAIILSPLAGLIVVGALTKAVSDRYMGEPATVGSAYSYIGKRAIPFVLTVVLAYAFVVSGFVLLFVGMVVFAFWVVFVTEIFVIEDKRYFSAIWRGKFLIGQGVWGEVIVLGFITGIIALIIQSPALVLSASVVVVGSRLWPLAGLLSGLTQSLAMPITLVSSILLYYDSRIRKEGFDLEVLARELGKALPPPQPPPAPPTESWPPAPPAPPSESAPGAGV